MAKISPLRKWKLKLAALPFRKAWNRVLIFFGKRTFRWEMSEYEKKTLEEATRKNFLPCLNLINSFGTGGVFEIQLSYRDRDNDSQINGIYELEILKADKGSPAFKITAPQGIPVGGVKYSNSYGLDKELRFQDRETRYVVSPNSIFEFNANFPRLPLLLTGRFAHVRSDNEENQNVYRRMIIPVKETDMVYPTAILEFRDNHMKFDLSSWDRQSSLLGLPFLSTKGMFSSIKIKGIQFHFYALEPINSVVIDSIDVITKEEFSKSTDIIRLAFAFLSGKYYREESVTFSSNDIDMSSILNLDLKKEEPTVLTDNQLINPNMFFDRYERQSAATKEQWKVYHTMFSSEVFSNFCEKLYDSVEFKRSVELMVNAGAISDPVQKGALYSVSLETLTEYLRNLDEEAFKPISDKAIYQTFRTGLQGELTKIKESIPESSFNILEKKLDNINSPTNRDKLIKPFQHLSIKLEPEDIEVLEHRNRYLHGDKPDDVTENKELLKIAFHLHSLIGKLVLKHVGYSGHYLNLHIWHTFNHRDDSLKEVDFNEAHMFLEKIKANNFSSKEEISRAKEVIENYYALLILAVDLEKLIVII